MPWRYVFKTSLTALLANKSRSALTILGIVIGIASIILVVSIGGAAEGLIVGELGGLGAETIVIRPGQEPEGFSDFTDLLFTDSLKERELDALLKKSNVPDLVDAAPEIIVTGNVTYGRESFKPGVILGFSAKFMEKALGLVIEEGRTFDDTDIRSRASVAVIGSRVKEELFGFNDAIGKQVQIKGRRFRIIGVYAPRGQVVFFDVDDLVLVPWTTAQTYLVGQDHFTQIIAQASSVDAVDRTVFDIQQTLRELHNITDPSKDDFHVQTQQGIVEQVSSIINIFTVFLSFVVAIALVVGGVGVMNIMLVSVAERTREIGLRKAVGATEGDIKRQFLTEAILLTGVGGAIGIAVGTFLALIASFGLSKYLNTPWVFIFPVFAALGGLAVSAGVGLLFGIYPASQAAKKSPMEALRYE